MKLKSLPATLPISLTLAACNSSSTQTSDHMTQSEACRQLQIAKGAAIDISLQLNQLDATNLKLAIPSQDLQTKISDLTSSLSQLGEKAPNEKTKKLAMQFASDLSTQEAKAMNQEISMESAYAITNDMTEVMSLCGVG